MNTENGERRISHISTTISSQDLQEFVGHILQPNLPHSLPLLRRCQYEITHPTHATGTEVWFAAATDETPTGAQTLTVNQVEALTVNKPWLAAYISLGNSGQTQVWVFGSWEADFNTLNFADPIHAMQQSDHCEIYRYLFFTLFRHLRTEHIPKLSHNPPVQWQRIRDEGKIVSLPFRRSKVLFGTLAECHWPFFDEYSSESERAVSRTDKGYMKYILSTKASLPYSNPPGNLHFAPMEERHLQTILDRSMIPRTIETLREIHVVGLFNKDATCVAWGMLSKDGSIGSLHTEPDHRRQGLAEAICRKLLADQSEVFAEDLATPDTPMYSHADVSKDNIPSRKTMEKLGCKVMWRVAWIEVDLGELKDSFPDM